MRLLQCKKSLKSSTTCLKVKGSLKVFVSVAPQFCTEYRPGWQRYYDAHQPTLQRTRRWEHGGLQLLRGRQLVWGAAWGMLSFPAGRGVQGERSCTCVCSLQHASSFLATPDGKCVSLHQIYTLRGIWEVVSAGMQQMFNTNFPLDVFPFVSFSCTCPSVLGDHHIHPIRVPGQFFRRLHNQFPQPHGCGEVLLPQLRWGRSHHQHWD